MTSSVRLGTIAVASAIVLLSAEPAQAGGFPCSACNPGGCNEEDAQAACDDNCFGWEWNLVCYEDLEPPNNYCLEPGFFHVVQCEQDNG